MKENYTCYHCGEPCDQEVIIANDHPFCCTGCHTVYRILNENGLDAFYAMDKHPGSPQRNIVTDFSWLDDPDTIARLLLFRSEDQSRILFELPQIHCASCVWLLEKLYRLHPGIIRSRVNFNKRELSVVFNESLLSLRNLVELLDRIGYRPALHLIDIEQSKRKNVNRRLIYQLGIAGFAFGNIMLFSFPEYLGLDRADIHGLAPYFGYLNMILAMPVFFYSAVDYYKSAWASIRAREINMDVPITLGILALFFQSAWEVLSLTGAGYFDSLAGLLFFMLTGKWFQQKTFDRLSFERDYRSYFPVAATMDDGSTQSLHLLQPKDVIQVRHGELVPADGILLEGHARIDYSFVTGESIPLPITTGGKIYAGGRQTGGLIRVYLTHTVRQSYLTQLWNDQAFQEGEKGKASRIAKVMGTRFTFVILTITIASLLYWWPHDHGKAIFAFTSVLIIACPCAIALAIPFIMGHGVRILGRTNAYVRHAQVIEQLASVDCIVWDKTGTLTVAGEGDIHWEGQPLSPEDREAIRAVAGQSTHPLSRQLFSSLEKSEKDTIQVTEFQEITGIGISGRVGGKIWRIGRDNSSNDVEDTITQTGIWKEGIFLGRYKFRPRYRANLMKVSRQFPQQIRQSLVSGDHPVDTEFLAKVVGGENRLHFRQQPMDKLEFIRSEQEAGHKVAMIGDGLNDAGALRQSDVGIVLTSSMNNFTPASDMILDGNQFDKLPAIFRFSRRLVMHVFIAYGLALLYNVVGLSFAVRGMLSPIVAAILMPASSISIVTYSWLASWMESKSAGLHEDDENHSPD